MRRSYERSLADLAFAEIGRFIAGSFAVFFAAVCVGIVILVLWNRMDVLWRGLFGLVALTILFFAVRRLRELKRLCEHGVEVEAHLIRVWDSQGSETDFRHADYRYEYEGRSYELTVMGVDFFMSSATRYGDDMTILVDPLRPESTAILGAMYH